MQCDIEQELSNVNSLLFSHVYVFWRWMLRDCLEDNNIFPKSFCSLTTIHINGTSVKSGKHAGTSWDVTHLKGPKTFKEIVLQNIFHQLLILMLLQNLFACIFVNLFLFLWLFIICIALWSHMKIFTYH